MADFPAQLLVRDLMSVGVFTCSPETPVPDLARLMVEKDLEAAVVMEEGNALGVVSQVELVKASTREDFRALTAGAVMREGVPQVPPDIPLAAAVGIMQDLGVRALFLMHHAAGMEYPAAYLSYRHLLRFLSANSLEELKDLGIQAERQSPLEAFIRRREAAREAARRGSK
jgi:hypothetical protein